MSDSRRKMMIEIEGSRDRDDGHFASTSSFRIRLYRPGDEVGIVDLINRAFGDDANFKQKTLAWWRWKYEQNPAGSCIVCLEGPDGKIVGHYGGSLADISASGGIAKSAQICDACIDPDLDLGLRRIGLFVRLARAFVPIAEPLGIGAAYGLPVPDHFVLGTRLAEYWILRSQPALVCRRRDALPKLPSDITIDHVDAVPWDYERFFSSFRRAFPVIGDRSAAFLKWRFFDAPGAPYSCGVARSRDGREIRGLAFYRSGEFLGRRTAVLVDWLLPPDDVVAGAALLHYAGDKALADGIEELTAFCPPTCAWASVFQDWGFRFEPTHYTMVHRPFHAGIDHGEMRRNWYYSLADLDAF